MKVRKVYIDICDNLRLFLRLNNKRLNKSKIRSYWYYFKYLFLKKINFVSQIKYRRVTIIVIYSCGNYNKVVKTVEKIIAQEKNVIISRELLRIIRNYSNENVIIKKQIEAIDNNKENYFKNIESVLKYTLKNNNIIIEQTRIYILIKNYNYLFENHIINISKLCNSVNIVTPKLGDFKNLEENIQNNIGASVTVSNNTRKSVSKAKYIINIDFNEKDINKYNLSRNSIIFNLSQNKLVNLKGFDGFVINNVGFLEKDNSLTRFVDRRFGILYDDDFEIINLVGNNGKIKG